MFLVGLVVQFRWANLGSARHDSQAAGAGNWLQDYGARAWLDARQEKGELHSNQLQIINRICC